MERRGGHFFRLWIAYSPWNKSNVVFLFFFFLHKLAQTRKKTKSGLLLVRIIILCVQSFSAEKKLNWCVLFFLCSAGDGEGFQCQNGFSIDFRGLKPIYFFWSFFLFMSSSYFVAVAIAIACHSWLNDFMWCSLALPKHVFDYHLFCREMLYARLYVQVIDKIFENHARTPKKTAKLKKTTITEKVCSHAHATNTMKVENDLFHRCFKIRLFLQCMSFEYFVMA